MTTAYWRSLSAALLPYLWVAIAKQSGQRYDNRDPRSWIARQDNPRAQRAYAAQLNAFEAFAPFAAAVLVAPAAGSSATMHRPSTGTTTSLIGNDAVSPSPRTAAFQPATAVSAAAAPWK